MKIELHKKANVLDFESKLELAYKRKRTDFKKLLTNVRDGVKINTLFPSTVASSITKRLRELELIDDGEHISKSGLDFIKDPYLEEIENGTYGFKALDISLESSKVNLIPEFSRKLSNQRRELIVNPIIDYEKNHQVKLDDEQVKFIGMSQPGQSKKVFQSKEPEVTNVIFNLINKTYSYESKYLDLGQELYDKLTNHAKNLLSNNPYGEYDIDVHQFIIRNGCKNLNDQELISGQIMNFRNEGLVLENVKFIIDDVTTAYQYLYFYAYNLLKDGNYYNLNDLNNIYYNELLGSGRFTSAIQKHLHSFEYSLTGFRQYLSKDNYNKLAYKLNVLEFLLGYKIAEDKFSNAKDYNQLVGIFNNFVPSTMVDSLFVVMGYPFAKNSRNQFMSFIENFQQNYNDIVIVKKGNKQSEDKNIIKQIEKMKIKVYENDKLIEYYHDRYLIFKMKDGKYKVYLVTCDIGSYFKIDSNDKMGSILELDYSELARENKEVNLLSILEGVINNA